MTKLTRLHSDCRIDAETFADLDGEYGSGFPYGAINDAAGNPTAINIYRVEPHITFDADVGSRLWRTHVGSGQLEFIVSNILNHPYVIKEASPFSQTQWAVGRTVGVKLTQTF